MELGPVVTRERVDRMGVLAQQGNRAAIHGGDGPGGELAQHEIPGLPLDQAEHTVAMALGAKDRVRFPVADAAPGLDDRRARRDRSFASEPAAAVVLAIALTTLFPGTAQVRVQRAAGPLVGPICR